MTVGGAEVVGTLSVRLSGSDLWWGVSGRADVDLVGMPGRLVGNVGWGIMGWKGVILRRNFLFLWVGALDPWMTTM